MGMNEWPLLDMFLVCTVFWLGCMPVKAVPYEIMCTPYR